jgi:hypothetical protein
MINLVKTVRCSYNYFTHGYTNLLITSADWNTCDKVLDQWTMVQKQSHSNQKFHNNEESGCNARWMLQADAWCNSKGLNKWLYQNWWSMIDFYFQQHNPYRSHIFHLRFFTQIECGLFVCFLTVVKINSLFTSLEKFPVGWWWITTSPHTKWVKTTCQMVYSGYSKK